MVRYILALVLLLQGCASIPQWSENPADCAYETGKYDEGFGKDVYTGVRKYWSSNLICAENPEVIKLPSYLQLLELPPAETMPIVAVYRFQDLTGQRKRQDNVASFSTAVSQGGVEMLIDALKTAGNGKWFRVVERSGLDHLVRERQIIRSAREEAGQEGLQPLLFAG